MKTKEEIIEEFEEQFGGYVLSNDKGVVTDLGIQNFISKALSQQKQEIVEEIEKELREWAIFYSGIEIDNIHLKHARDVIIADLLNEITELKQKLTK